MTLFRSLRHHLARCALVAASFVTTSALMLALGAAFDGASREPWLRDSPQARVAVAACESRAARGGRRDCLRAVVAQARMRDAGAARLAALVPAAPGAAR